MGAAAAERFYVLERSIVSLLFLASRLMRREDIAPIILQSLRMLLLLKSQVLDSYILFNIYVKLVFPRFWQEFRAKWLTDFMNY